MSKKISKFVKQVDQIISDLEKNKPEEYTIDKTDLYLPYNHMFTPAAKRGMSRKLSGLEAKRKIQFLNSLDEFADDKVEFFAAIAIGEEKIVKAARMITDFINKMAAKGYVTGHVERLAVMKVVSEPHELEKYAVISFISVTKQGVKFILDEKPNFCISDDPSGLSGPEID